MKKLFTITLLIAATVSLQAQTAFYTTTFSGGIGSWTTSRNSGNPNEIWKWKTGTFSSYYSGTVTFKSTTAGNGFMLFMSDSTINRNNGTPEDADLISPAINCSTQDYVFLQFDHYYRHGSGSTASIFVSSDNVNWYQVYALATSSTNGKQTVIDISSYAAHQSTVYVKFNYQGDWDYFWAVDDVKLIAAPELDVSVDTVTMPKYVGISTQQVTGILTNRGATTINSFDLTYTDNGGTPVSQSFTGLSIAPLASYPFTFTQPIVMNSAIQHNIVVTASSPNNGTDAATANNTWTQGVITLSAVPVRNVLLEEFTTAACQYCPDAGSRLIDIIGRNTNMFLASLHAGFGTDAMTIPDHSTVATQYTTSAPAVMVDRVYYDSELGADIGFYNDPYDRWEPYANARKLVTTPVGIIADNTYDSATRVLTVNASAKFYSAITDEFRINCYIIEDSVSGTGSGYNQQNAYNNDQSSPWYQKGSPIVNYQHRHVVRQMMGGAWGSSGSVPTTTVEGTVYTKQFTYTLPVSWDVSQITLIPLVQHYSAGNKFDRQIMNALELHLNTADSTGAVITSAILETKGSSVRAMDIFPNPTSDILNIDYSVTSSAKISFDVFNIIGQSVHSIAPENLSSGEYRNQINTANFNNGVYFVALKEGNKVVKTLKFIVSK